MTNSARSASPSQTHSILLLALYGLSAIVCRCLYYHHYWPLAASVSIDGLANCDDKLTGDNKSIDMNTLQYSTK